MLTAALNPVVQIVKVLGEGGFSFVYLAQDEASGVSIDVNVAMMHCNSRRADVDVMM